MFVVTYDLTDMPSRSQTFIRQKTVYAPCDTQKSVVHGKMSSMSKLPTYLRYLIHLRFRSTKTDKVNNEQSTIISARMMVGEIDAVKTMTNGNMLL